MRRAFAAGRPNRECCSVLSLNMLFICPVFELAMYFPIARMREKGVARSWTDIRHSVPIRGDVNIRTSRAKHLTKISDIASVRSLVPLAPSALMPF